MSEKSQPKLAVIGGGTGSFTLLNTLKMHTNKITALVNMADDGGSTGVLRDELGVLPPGDIRQCLVALSESTQALRDLFNYRFPEESTLASHSFGNLFLSAVEMMTSDFGEAVSLASEVLHIKGKVVPITLQNCNLVTKIGSKKIVGQYKIETQEFDGKLKPNLWLEPEAPINPVAATAIKEADLVVIAPGNLYGSLIPALLVDGVSDALQKTKAPVVYVCNLVNKPSHTVSYNVHDYVSEIERFIGEGTIDTVLYNTDHPSKEILEAYALDGEYPVKVDKNEFKHKSYKAIGGKYLSHRSHSRNANDKFIMRSLIRHDAEAIVKQLLKLARDE